MAVFAVNSRRVEALCPVFMWVYKTRISFESCIFYDKYISRLQVLSMLICAKFDETKDYERLGAQGKQSAI